MRGCGALGGFHEATNPGCDLAVLDGTAGPHGIDEYARGA